MLLQAQRGSCAILHQINDHMGGLFMQDFFLHESVVNRSTVCFQGIPEQCNYNVCISSLMGSGCGSEAEHLLCMWKVHGIST